MLPPRIDLRVPRAFTTLAIGLAGAAVGASIVPWMLSWVLQAPVHADVAWLGALSTGVLCLATAGWVLRSGAAGHPRAVLAWFAFAGAANAGVVLFGLGAMMGEHRVALFLAGLAVGGAFAAPLGLVFGAGSIPALRGWVRLHRNPSWYGRTRLFARVGGWLVIAGLFALAIADGSAAFRSAVACLVVGGSAALGALAVRSGGARWIARVASNRVAGWTICSTEDVEIPPGLARWTARFDPFAAPPVVLCRVAVGRRGERSLSPYLRVPAELVAP